MQDSDPLLTRFFHIYYLFRLLACFPALLYWLLLTIPTHSSSAQQISFLWSSPAHPVHPAHRYPSLRSLATQTDSKKKFDLFTLSHETLLDTWVVNFVAFNLGTLAYLGGWIPAITYLACLLSFNVVCPKPAYQGPSRVRVMCPETFTAKILNRNYTSVVGFSASELLNLTPEKLKAELATQSGVPNDQFSSKKWIIWPISEARRRPQVGFMDMEIILANLSLEFENSDELEFIILEMKNSNSLCSTLKIWAEDDSASSPIQPVVDDFVLLQYQAGREIRRLPERQLSNGDSSDDEEDLPVQNAHSRTTVLWSEETIVKAFKLK
ncbi:hypothetical protein Pst134EA_009680 [Puccinia striiformis f. sp. tritici]|uniref:hypothetical protein n=1 Tax=Puccinia striiformis f. sp. tritici TaxID=168172 RepID=UPI002007D1A9|nr:hypothetical protein Pst134EA_009680 [Puccinia striiformis f. sp. tritici]KAH9469151.1 hypothetical protein Pst134EA_009680 [Puccinia striiformis f. sp. tritici]